MPDYKLERNPKKITIVDQICIAQITGKREKQNRKSECHDGRHRSSKCSAISGSRISCADVAGNICRGCFFPTDFSLYTWFWGGWPCAARSRMADRSTAVAFFALDTETIFVRAFAFIPTRPPALSKRATRFASFQDDPRYLSLDFPPSRRTSRDIRWGYSEIEFSESILFRSQIRFVSILWE